MADAKKKNICEKIVDISNEIRIKNKAGKNSFKGFDYYKPEQINEAINPLLQKYSLAIFFHFLPCREYIRTKTETVKKVSGEEVKVIETTVKEYKCRLEVVDYESGETKQFISEYPEADIQGATDIQNRGGTMTYAKRYMLMNVFNIGDCSIDPDNKQENQKHKDNKRITVMEAGDRIDKIKKSEDIDKAYDWIEDSAFNDTQKNLLHRKLEEKAKQFKV